MKFRAAREYLGLTQAELGKIMGMTQPAIARLEAGGQGITKIQAAFVRYLLEHKP